MPSCTRRLLESQEPFIQSPEPHWLGITGCQTLGPRQRWRYSPYSQDYSSPRGTGMFTDNVRIGGNAGTAQPPALRDHRGGANHTALRNISPIKEERGLPPPRILKETSGTWIKKMGAVWNSLAFPQNLNRVNRVTQQNHPGVYTQEK